ncbi:hypothetical protein ACTMTF_28650 [Nonomuraea sp. ZG12]|uniref:hypothetical protein n=1 Tax=Nonomuraea sp. ZG12 TaxID=3452207 RepID=UPI003F891710
MKPRLAVPSMAGVPLRILLDAAARNQEATDREGVGEMTIGFGFYSRVSTESNLVPEASWGWRLRLKDRTSSKTIMAVYIRQRVSLARSIATQLGHE